MKIIPASDSSLLVVLGDAIAPEVQSAVLDLFQALQALGERRIRNLHLGYVSLLVDFDPLAMTHADAAELVQRSLDCGSHIVQTASRTLEIPVCYGGEFGPDLDDVARHAQLSADEVVRLHAGASYEVCFLGFTAGFAYLGGLPEELATPRLATPRRAVAIGSVGIAGRQTGIYPAATPGGWRLIGRTPLTMFDPRNEPPTRLLPGDRVRFVAIERAEFDRHRQEVGR